MIWSLNVVKGQVFNGKAASVMVYEGGNAEAGGGGQQIREQRE